MNSRCGIVSSLCQARPAAALQPKVGLVTWAKDAGGCGQMRAEHAMTCHDVRQCSGWM